MYPLAFRRGGAGNWPSLNRSTAVAMVLLQATAVTLLMTPILLPVAAVALAGWVAPQMKLVFNLPVKISFALILMLIVLQHQVLEEEFLAMGFIGSKIAFEVSCFCIGCQLLMFFVKKYAVRLPAWYLGISGTSMVFSGDIRVSYLNNNRMFWIVIAYTVCWMGFAMSSRISMPQMTRNRWFRTTALLATFVTGVFTAQLLSVTFQKYSSRLEFWMTEYIYRGRMSTGGAGFSGKGGLRDILDLKTNDGNQVALRIDASFYPDYLRGRVFTVFSQERWAPSESLDILEPDPELTSLRPMYPHESVFKLQPEWPVSPKEMTVWPYDTMTSSHFFLPLGAAALSCDGNAIKFDGNGIFERDSRSDLESYLVLIADPPRTPPGELNPAFLTLPDRLNKQVPPIAEAIFAGTKTTSEKLAAVESFFHDNFTYSMSFRPPRGVDRLSYFLTTRSAANCEYFATASTILLRLAGVPSRYVTGYVVSGRNLIDGSYLALRQDAHAWCEAYDEEREQWVTVECTPVEGVPGHRELTLTNSATSFGKGLFLQTLELFRSGGLWILGEAYARWIVILVPLIGGLMVSGQYFLKNQLTLRRNEHELNPAFVPLARERIRMDRFLARRGFQRSPDESILSFANRIEHAHALTTSDSLATWYRDYATIRFQDRPIEAETIAAIREQRQNLARSTKVTS